MTRVGFPSPEDAALSVWVGYAAALARVVEVTYETAERAVVVTAFHPDDPVTTVVERTGDLWTPRLP